MTDTLRIHDVTLRGDHVVLRPTTEDDWSLIDRWWNDPDIAYYADDNEGDYSLERLQRIMRTISQKAHCFVIEHRGKPVGECWLQELNLPRLLERYPDQDVRRIDIEIVKELWGKGLGSEAIKLLVDLGFSRDGADAIFGCEIADYNPRSLAAFRKAGFVPHGTVPQKSGGHGHDFFITREGWSETQHGR